MITILKAESWFLPDMKLPKPCPIKVEIDENNHRVFMYIGHAYFMWDMVAGAVAEGTGKCNGSSTEGQGG